MDDCCKIFDGVVVEAVGNAESGAKGGAEEAGTRGGSDQCEAGKVKTNGAGGWALIDDDIDAEIFDSGVEVLLDDFVS